MNYAVHQPTGGDRLADILERVLDKGIVVAGDVTVSLVGIELLSIKVRLIVATVGRAQHSTTQAPCAEHGRQIRERHMNDEDREKPAPIGIEALNEMGRRLLDVLGSVEQTFTQNQTSRSRSFTIKTPRGRLAGNIGF